MISKLKNWLGIEGVKVKIVQDEPFDPDHNEMSGRVILSSQTEQFVQSLQFKLIERYSRGRRKGKLIDEYILGQKEVRVYKLVLPGKTLEIPFCLNYEITPSAIDSFGDKNILFKGISGVAKWLKSAKSDYHLICEAQVKGNALKPYEKLLLN